MMQLSIYKPLPYISYSTFNLARACQYSAYLIKCSKHTIPRETETEQMALGTAFDAYIKYYLALELGKEKEGKNKLAQLLSGIAESNAHVMTLGHEICRYYIAQGKLTHLMEMGLTDIELIEEKHVKSPKIIAGIPIFGRLDAVLKNNVPLDWKVTGYKSTRTVSPKKAYYRRIQCGIEQPPHHEVGLPLELINKDWAEQLLFYNWLMGNKLYRGAIELIVVTPNGLDFCSYAANISSDFSDALFDEVTEMWDKLSSGDITTPIPSPKTCEPYNRLRPCTPYCQYYNANISPLDQLIQKR